MCTKFQPPGTSLTRVIGENVFWPLFTSKLFAKMHTFVITRLPPLFLYSGAWNFASRRKIERRTRFWRQIGHQTSLRMSKRLIFRFFCFFGSIFREARRAWSQSRISFPIKPKCSSKQGLSNDVSEKCGTGPRLGATGRHRKCRKIIFFTWKSKVLQFPCPSVSLWAP